MNPALAQLLERRYRALRRTALITGGIALAVIVAGVLWGIGSMVAGPSCPKGRFHAACVDHFYRDVVTRSVVIGVLAGVFLLIALVAFWPLRDLSQAPLLRVFSSRRSEVVWIYPKRTSVRRYGVEVRAIHAVVVGLLDRKRLSLNMTEDEVTEALRLMGLEAPRAARGYTAEQEKRFLRDPAAMLGSAATLVSAVAPTAGPS